MFIRLCLLIVACLSLVNSKLPPKSFFHLRPFYDLVPKAPIEHSFTKSLPAHISIAYFTQKLDHFDLSETKTWKQLYQMNNETYRAGGPIFVNIGGEAPADIGWMTYGQWYKNAKMYGALMFQLEHRFYGQSRPFSDCSDENLKYLTSEQALADLDAFIKAMIIQYNIQKVIVFGCSYAGNLAAWYRAKYSTAIGSIASSGPVTAEVDFSQYLENVGFTMDYFIPGCQSEVERGFASLQSLVNSKDTSTINSLFQPCFSPLRYNDPYDIAMFFNSLIEPWKYAVQYSAAEAYFSKVYEMCSNVTNAKNGVDPLHRLSALYKTLQNCTFHNYYYTIFLLKQTDWSDYWVSSGTRQWTWQTCNEFGYFQSTDSANQPFGQTVPLKFLEDIFCTKTFGQSNWQINRNVENLNNNYGGVDGPEKNVFFSDGSLDPWHNLAIYKIAPDPSDTLKYMTGTSHCYDLRDDFFTDPPQVRDVRNQITQQIGLWLNELPSTRTYGSFDIGDDSTTDPPQLTSVINPTTQLTEEWTQQTHLNKCCKTCLPILRIMLFCCFIVLLNFS